MRVEKQTAFRFAWLVAVVSLAAGCSTMDADECRAATWSGLGYADASKGKDVSMAGDRAQACSEHGYRMDMAAYQRGWNEGLKEFCTFPGGQAFGDRGGNYKPGYCPPGAESQFLASYLPAYKRYQYQQRIDGLQVASVGSTPLMKFLHPEIITVDPGYAESGRQAAAQLIEQITGRAEPRQIVIPAHLS